MSNHWFGTFPRKGLTGCETVNLMSGFLFFFLVHKVIRLLFKLKVVRMIYPIALTDGRTVYMHGDENDTISHVFSTSPAF